MPRKRLTGVGGGFGTPSRRKWGSAKQKLALQKAIEASADARRKNRVESPSTKRRKAEEAKGGVKRGKGGVAKGKISLARQEAGRISREFNLSGHNRSDENKAAYREAAKVARALKKEYGDDAPTADRIYSEAKKIQLKNPTGRRGNEGKRGEGLKVLQAKRDGSSAPKSAAAADTKSQKSQKSQGRTNLPGGYTVDKVEARRAYARNGNADNPTKYYRYEVRNSDGKLIGSTRSLSGAKDLVSEDRKLKSKSSTPDARDYVGEHKLSRDRRKRGVDDGRSKPTVGKANSGNLTPEEEKERANLVERERKGLITVPEADRLNELEKKSLGNGDSRGRAANEKADAKKKADAAKAEAGSVKSDTRPQMWQEQRDIWQRHYDGAENDAERKALVDAMAPKGWRVVGGEIKSIHPNVTEALENNKRLERDAARITRLSDRELQDALERSKGTKYEKTFKDEDERRKKLEDSLGKGVAADRRPSPKAKSGNGSGAKREKKAPAKRTPSQIRADQLAITKQFKELLSGFDDADENRKNELRAKYRELMAKEEILDREMAETEPKRDRKVTEGNSAKEVAEIFVDRHPGTNVPDPEHELNAAYERKIKRFTDAGFDSYRAKQAAGDRELLDQAYKSHMRGLDDMMAKYSTIRVNDASLVDIPNRPDGGTVGAQCCRGAGLIRIEANVSQIADAAKVVREARSAKGTMARWHYKGYDKAPFRYNAYHEFGHAVEWYALLDGDNKMSGEERDQLTRRARDEMYELLADLWVSEGKPAAASSSELRNPTDEDHFEHWLYENLSGYSFGETPSFVERGAKLEPGDKLPQVSISEAIAEAFADVEFNGENAGKASQAIHKWIIGKLEERNRRLGE